MDIKGIGNNRTSYNEKQEVSSYNIGVLKYNTNIRNEILKRNIGKYQMYEETLIPAIGEYYDIYNRENNLYTPIGEGGIYAYTNDNNTEYSKELNKKYYRDPDNIESYEIINPSPHLLAKWGGKYENYIDHVFNTYGKEYKINMFLYDLLGENDIKYAMINDRVGVVRDINAAYSLSGVMITNINNFSGKDTELGTITNKLYALTLSNAAYFNSLRGTKYITPSLVSVYGNNLTNLNKLKDMFTVSDDTGKLSIEPDNGDYIKTVERIYDITGDENISKYLYNNLAYNNSENFDYQYEANLLNNNINKTSYSLTNFDQVDLSSDLSSVFGNTNNITLQKNIFIKKRYKPTSPYVRNIFEHFINDRGILLNDGIEILNESNNKSLYKSSDENTVIYGIYSEGDNNKSSSNELSVTDGDGNTYNSLPLTYESTSLLDRTNKLFDARKIGTLIGRFHTTEDTTPNHNIGTLIQSSVSRYGLSHGRNLLKKDRNKYNNPGDDINGYNNPYCRVWTYHHQYNKIKNLIRPFTTNNGISERTLTIDEIQENQKLIRHSKGIKHLSDNTVLNNNGFVNITPTDNGISIKKCMFSIENLAWKDVLKINNNLSPEQVGPLGGRIMWFPPYNIKFTENTSVGWNSNDFIGRGEKIYSYVNTERSGTLSFTLLIDHPSILNYWKNGKESIKENDDDILRFFAGCDLLEVDDSISADNTDTNGEISNNNEPKETIPEGDSIVFYVYFPNNYSGIDDLPNGNTMVNSILYLFMGKGVQKSNLISPSDVDLTNNYINSPGYEMCDIGITSDTNPDETGDVIVGKNGNWGYRIDSEYIDQKLNEKGNYYDYESYKLNSIIGNQPSDATYTFAEILAGYYKDKDKENGSKIVDRALSLGCNKERIDSFSNIVSKYERKITQIDISGSASSHGSIDKNNNLNKDRATTIKKWIQSMFGNKISDIKWGNGGNSIKETKSNSQSDIEAKLGRCARIEIFFENSKTQNLSDTDPNSTNEEVAQYSNIFNENYDIDVSELANNINDTPVRIITTSSSTDINRYENESNFFTTLSANSPMIRKMIVDKIKYFDPAYHSISPEGFNARLTFLHQCTRQGHTIDASDRNGNSANTAGNLAFGRPPVCVLRIGDFFNTRIIIDSLNINYDPMVWDLNPEGVGVQPMFANIDLTFKFIGGSDLGGPISRLQNAVSFNYYANSSVYDNRADRVIYDDNKNNYGITNETYDNIWMPENKE